GSLAGAWATTVWPMTCWLTIVPYAMAWNARNGLPNAVNGPTKHIQPALSLALYTNANPIPHQHCGYPAHLVLEISAHAKSFKWHGHSNSVIRPSVVHSLRCLWAR